MSRVSPLAFGVALLLAAPLAAQEPSGLQKSLKDVEVHGSWIYNDLDKGYAEAAKSGKPLLIVFRCVL